ncbi:POTRA domain-containing protein [Sinimarinibacterium sp. NLF-5-8]|uniref:POTRA domain-containing protein n=1 Tax=Sinimarinibacterium sp. NLF-5-8 TaxID=2698684 RepID=UPI00137C36E3|nr:POTRA domain-containing protein [Sinimarinibacterium sp. NLF-5-8]QHS09784.1 hypothetical protein GT972_06195 [Sinimarinibacterium sp. NLF-5-8]
MSLRWVLLLGTLLLLPGTCEGAQAVLINDSAPRIAEIVFEGNTVTRESVMRHEMSIHEGMQFDADALARSRQEIQSLGLFRSVEARVESVGESQAAVRVVFKVHEKWFWQAYPRLSANSDGQNSIGLESKVNNLWGLNHTFKLVGRSRDSRRDDRGRDVSIRASYLAPYLLSSKDSLRLSAEHNVTPFELPAVYEETVDAVEAVVIHNYGLPNRPSQGWSTGYGLAGRRHRVSDHAAAMSFGNSYAVVFENDYRNVRDRIFSIDGRALGTRLEWADEHVFSDYSAASFVANWEQAQPIGQRLHQQWGYGISLGWADHSRDIRPAFALGSTDGLKGYERRSFEGNSFYLAHIDFMRPLRWDSLRWTVGLEAGNASQSARDLGQALHVSANIGLRWRPRRLINFEIELGLAMPLQGGGTRIYGGKMDQGLK